MVNTTGFSSQYRGICLTVLLVKENIITVIPICHSYLRTLDDPFSIALTVYLSLIMGLIGFKPDSETYQRLKNDPDRM